MCSATGPKRPDNDLPEESKQRLLAGAAIEFLGLGEARFAQAAVSDAADP